VVVQFVAAGDSAERSDSLLGFFAWGIYCLQMIANCYALGAFGIWLALTAKKPALAPTLTILFALILPSVLCWLDIFADIFFIAWGVSKLYAVDLRLLLTQEYRGNVATPALPPVVAR
jgi:hypothetical protein